MKLTRSTGATASKASSARDDAAQTTAPRHRSLLPFIVATIKGILSNGLTGLTYEQITGQSNPSASTLWWSFAIDAYFVLGGILFGLAASAFGHSRRPWR